MSISLLYFSWLFPSVSLVFRLFRCKSYCANRVHKISRLMILTGHPGFWCVNQLRSEQISLRVYESTILVVFFSVVSYSTSVEAKQFVLHKILISLNRQLPQFGQILWNSPENRRETVNVCCCQSEKIEEAKNPWRAKSWCYLGLSL